MSNFVDLHFLWFLGGGVADPEIRFWDGHDPKNPGWYEFRVKRPKIAQNKSNSGPKMLELWLFLLSLRSRTNIHSIFKIKLSASEEIFFSNFRLLKIPTQKIKIFRVFWLKKHQNPSSFDQNRQV